MRKSIKKIISVLLCITFVFSLSACSGGINNSELKDVFNSMKKACYSENYYELSKKKNKQEKWRQGMISGNGLQGFVTSGAPYSDSFILQNMHFILPNENVRNCPDTKNELEAVKQNIIQGKDITDNASYDDVYSFHPGGALRIDFEKGKEKNYMRYTNYETAEVGVKFEDKNGVWQRSSFTSQEDGVVITKLSKSSKGKKLNITLSYDNLSSIANFGKGNETDLKYKKLSGSDSSSIAFVAHYPNYKNSELKNGGYASYTYIIAENAVPEKSSGKAVNDKQYASDENPEIKISNADSIYLISVSDRTDDMGKFDDFDLQSEFELVKRLAQKTKAVAEKYGENGGFNYDKALSEHLKKWKPQYDAVDFELEDSEKSNEALIKEQKGEDDIKLALAQRAYYSGRYAYLSAAGYSTTRLYGMWTGEFDPGWGCKYTMDANVNLQTDSMNSSNIESAPIGYAQFILRQVDDWEENAMNTHGYTDAIQAPVHEDGDCAALTETCYPYPFRYWNAGASWMLQPLFETLETYGEVQIPITEEYDLNKLKSVLSVTPDDLTDEQINALKAKGYLDLRRDILLPLLIKSSNYWAQLLSPEYYTDKNGDIHYQKGKTALNDDEYYCIVPSYSPENNPKNYQSPSTANCAIDISACRDNLRMLIEIQKSVDANADVSKWENIIEKLPPYTFDSTGALKEWACNLFEENNEHRHLSHMYLVWPLDETQDDEKLKAACVQAIKNRASENESSHALVHRALIAARLKDRASLTDALVTLMNNKIYYDSLMTNHNFDRSSAYCTDFGIGYLGIVNESLVYSNPGKIELLPALANSGFNKGTVSGLKTRTRAEITAMSWDLESKTLTVKIKSDVNQSIKISTLMAGKAYNDNFKAGEEKKYSFKLN